MKAAWTVLTYIAAHNNLDPFGRKSLHEILKVGSTADVVHGALYDGPSGAGRYVMGDPGTVSSQEQLGSYDSGDPAGVIATARWLFDKHPAERYALVLWSHGSGWEPEELDQIAQEARGPGAGASDATQRSGGAGMPFLFRTTLRTMLTPRAANERAILFDDGTGHSLDTLELARVTGSLREAIGQPIDVLGMDACLMANVEVAYEIRNDVRCLVASEELVPGHSWPYEEIYGALRDAPEQDARDFAKLVVDKYTSFYEKNPPAGGDVTKIALDLARIDDIANAAGALAGALRGEMESVGDTLWRVQRETRKRETNGGQRKPSKFDFDLWDVGSVAAGLCAESTVAAAVRGAAETAIAAFKPGNGAVLAERHRGAWFDGIGGASVFLPTGQTRVSEWYGKLAYARDTRWGDMLDAYRAHLA